MATTPCIARIKKRKAVTPVVVSWRHLRVSGVRISNSLRFPYPVRFSSYLQYIPGESERYLSGNRKKWSAVHI